MRRLILSDIHSNLEALEAVLRQAEGAYEEIVCCGDLVGYNASPAEVIAWARENAAVIVRGNHDRGCCGLEDLEWFNTPAQSAAAWTMETLSERDLRWLRELPKGPLVFDEYEIVHGSPVDEDDYLIQGPEVAALAQALERKICFGGHTHIQGGWTWQRGGLQRLTKPGESEDERIIDLDPDYRYLINPGSVGQPRDGDPRAAYVIWDSDERLLRFRRARYDVRGAQERILTEGLPSGLAARLAEGR